MKKIILVVVLLSVFVLLVGCSFNEVEDITINFYDGNTLLETSTVYKYNKNPFVPTKDGFEFTCWYLDYERTKPAVFDEIKSDCSLYAGWIEKGDGSRNFHIVFCALDGSTLKQMTVGKIQDIVFPDAPKIEGYSFVKWDNLPSELNADLILYPIYAKEFTVEFYFDVNDTVPLSRQIVLEGENAVAPQNPTKNGDMQYSYSFNGWSESFENVKKDLKIYAKFTRTTNKYTYVFKNYDGAILSSKNANYGTKINPPTAKKESDENYVYTFIGWDLTGDNIPDALPDILTDNFEAKACFQTNLKSFVVNFYVDDYLISSEEVTYGEAVSFKGNTPEKENTPQFEYKFVGWDKSFEFITEDTDVYAIFESVIRKYTYSFVDCTGTIVTETAEYGTPIVAPQPHEKEKDDSFVYPFSHWSDYSEGMILDNDYTFNAVYNAEKRLFTYTFYVGMTIILRVTAEYGTLIVPPEPPESSDGSVFVLWIGYTEGMILTKDISFSARYA